ncbi:MAG: hypothetical protein JNK95_04645 [Candidatus Competibacter sp.]|nr:hypothetical protein [Candidatus Competibacter sp.]MDG4605570.1 hypothetical protein [Candidatus Contendobacter sp.]HRD48712.1 hypothetical protein [Candidatus Contendobacter sp.]
MAATLYGAGKECRSFYTHSNERQDWRQGVSGDFTHPIKRVLIVREGRKSGKNRVAEWFIE